MRRPRLASMVRPRVTSPARQAFAFSLAVGALGTVAGCTDLPAPGASSESSPIFGGTLDTTDTAVMALINQGSATSASSCSGTIIATSGAEGVFLTAGHCVVANDGMGHVTTPVTVTSPDSIFIVPGPDWQTSVHNGQYYGVAQVSVHPQYDGSVQSPFDVGLVRFLGALPSTPVIPVLAAADDKLATGSAITVVGFGKTMTDAQNSARYEVPRVIQTITANQFLYDQTDLKGACEGDSGGPTLVDTPAAPRVGGVTSFGDPDCTKNGASVRVSPVYTSYIQAFINAVPKTLSCDDCALASVAPGNACINQSITCGQPSSACGSYVSCAGGCTNQACIDQCQRSNPAGANAYGAIVACQCGGTCKTACANNPVCGGSGGTGAGGASGGTGQAGSVGSTGAAGSSGAAGTSGAAGSSGGNFACTDFTDPRMACQTCMQSSCCQQAIACAGDTTCTACRIDASSSQCRLNVAFTMIGQCLASCSGSPCSVTATGAAGTAGTVGQAAAKSGCSCDAGAPSGSPSGLNLGLGTLLALGLAVARPRRRR